MLVQYRTLSTQKNTYKSRLAICIAITVAFVPMAMYFDPTPLDTLEGGGDRMGAKTIAANKAQR